MVKIAKLAIQSSLPQLDRLFDYAVPSELLQTVGIGSRVLVPFGRSKKLLEAFVVGFAEQSKFEGKLSEIESVIGAGPVLQKNVFELCKELSERSATTLGELTKLAIPPHMPRAFATHQKQDWLIREPPKHITFQFPDGYIDTLMESDTRHFCLAEPRMTTVSNGESKCEVPSWLAVSLAIAVNNLRSGKSTIVLVPDYREHEVAKLAIQALGLEVHLVDYSQDQQKSKQYSAFLKALEPYPTIVLGSRSAAFAPCHELGSILIFDEADRSYFDQSSPYLSTRDVVLLRQSIDKCSMVFASHSMSSDLKRLLDTGYLRDATLMYAAPRVSVSEPGLRVDSHAYQSIKQGLEQGPVLVQVASLGESTSLYCKACDTPAKCAGCQGPLWIDSLGKTKCRCCNGFALDHRCLCGSTEFSLGRPGATRTAAELGRAFPKVKVIESTGEKRLVSIPSGRSLVVATSGAEPYVAGGYASVVLLDAKVSMAKQNLRAVEDSVRSWSNAIAKASPTGTSVLVGVSGELSKLFALWNHSGIAGNELVSRAELSLPPVVRMGSITAELELVSSLSSVLSNIPSVQKIGPAPIKSAGTTELWRLIFKYPYSEGLNVARVIKVEVARISSGKTRVGASGRNTRAITVKMNDAEVV